MWTVVLLCISLTAGGTLFSFVAVLDIGRSTLSADLDSAVLPCCQTPDDTLPHCAGRHLAKSWDSRHPVDIEVVNSSNHTLSVFWVDFEGQEVYYGMFKPEPDKAVQLHTYKTHPWRLYIAKQPDLVLEFVSTHNTELLRRHHSTADSISLSCVAPVPLQWSWGALHKLCKHRDAQWACTASWEFLRSSAWGFCLGFVCGTALLTPVRERMLRLLPKAMRTL
jgi:hypothetical protein